MEQTCRPTSSGDDADRTVQRMKSESTPLSWKRSPAIFGAFLWVVITTAPLIAGIVGTYDPRGPIFYPRLYHEFLHTIGNAIAGRHGTKIPFAERPLFYGLKGKPLKEDWRKTRSSPTPYPKPAPEPNLQNDQR